VSREVVSLWQINATDLTLLGTTNLSGLRINYRAALTRNGRVAVTAVDNDLTFRRVTGAENVLVAANSAPAIRSDWHSHAVIGLTSDAKGNLAILSFDDDNVLRLWSLTKGETAYHSGDVLHLDFSPDDQSLLHVSKELWSYIWDVKTRRIKTTLSGYNEQIDRAAFSPNGQFVVAGSFDNSVYLWSSRTGHRLATFPGDGDRWRTADFALDGLALIAVSVLKSGGKVTAYGFGG
jgi:WD40 repeat protein